MAAGRRLDVVGGWARSHRSDLLAVALLLVLGALFVAPSLKDGGSFGGFDLDTTLTPLGAGVYSSVHSLTNGDAVSQMIAWNDLDWRLIHSGHFPMWNQYEVLGMPQFLNFESSVLSLPDLVSYLAPLRFAFLVVVVVKLWIAGLGVYLLARVLRCRPLSALLGGVSFMFAGAFAGWLTWPLSDVVAWTGFVAAFGVLALRPTGRLRHVGGLAVSVAFSIYGGFPEANVMVAVALGATVVVAGSIVVLRRTAPDRAGLARAGVGGLLGGMLAAPLWLPGLQVIAVSHRTSEGHYVGLPTRTIALLVSQGYFGLPTGPNASFQLRLWNYYETVTYVGAIAIVLVVVAIGTSFRRPVVAGLTVALVISLALTYQPVSFHPLQSLVNSLPGLSAVRFERMRSLTAFLVAVLAALGLEQLVARSSSRAVRRSFALGSLVVVGFVAYLDVDSALDPALRHQRVGPLMWPNLTAIGLVLAAGWLSRGGARRGTGVLAAAMVVAQGSFLFFAGVGIPSYSRPFFAVTGPIAQLKTAVGDALVGLDGGNSANVRFFSHVGFYPNVNIGYSIRMFGVHDPLIPASYFESWPIRSAAPNHGGVGLFVPDVDTVALARRYGIGYLLSGPGISPPPGTVRVGTIAGETLSRVPRSATFAFVGGSDRVTSSSTVGDGSWAITTEGSRAGDLVLRITDLPGMHASIDGRSLALHPYQHVMLEAHVPAGHHRIVVTYRPGRLLAGLLAALLALTALLGAAGTALVRSRRGAAEVGANP